MRPWLVHGDLPLLGQVALSAWVTFLVVAISLALVVAAQEARRGGDPPTVLLRGAMVGIVAGVIGGRLGHLFTSHRDDYLADPLALLRFWEGGMVLYGGLALGTIAAVAWLRSRSASIPRAADAAAPAAALGIAVGRIGCLSAGCCYGRPIDWGTGVEWPWGLVFLQGVVPEPLRGIPLHPTQVYSALAALLLFGALRRLRARQSFDGQTAGVFLVAYAILRSIVEAFRLDLERGFVLPDLVGEVISTSQAFSLPVLLGGCAVLLTARARAIREGTYGLGPGDAGAARVRARIERALAA
jgi:phosphatidylglycerol:prolipoprotein diacylglycerol transferase